MRVQILGPVRAWRDGVDLDLGSPRQRAVFALLAAAAGKPLMRTDMVDALWGGSPPPSAANIISTYVKNLRRILEPDRQRRSASRFLPRVGDGYVLLVPTDGLDLTLFRRLVGDAGKSQRVHDWTRAARLLDEALGLWQGLPLADLEFLAGHPKIVALAEERWAAVARYGDAMIAMETAGDALPLLREAATARPMDEAAQARLIRAYQAAGRQSDGFELYHEVRRRLADELGVDPGPELVAVYTALVRGDVPPAVSTVVGAAQPVELSGADEDVAPAGAQGPMTAAQLPIDLAAFAGRTDDLSRLDKHLSGEDSRSAPVVISISGPPGIGKTTLAVHWAHRVAGQFPDGQLFASLRGFDVIASVADPADVLLGFLEALQVPSSQIPSTLDGRVSAYRSHISGRRMLVVLDNARDAEQVRPLLPGCSGCFVVVTSRNQLTGLIAAQGAQPVRLDVLTATEAWQMLERRLGVERIAGQPQPVADIIQRCTGLPLALAVVAARAATIPDVPLADIAAELDAGLDGFASGDTATDVRAVFSASYHALGAPAQRLFRLLAVHPGPDISGSAAASLAALSLSQARQQLAELTRTNLLSEHRQGRYALHDLLRAYASELADDVDSDHERRTAQRRFLDHYLHTAHTAAVLTNPHRDPISLDPPVPGVIPETLTDHRQALAWFTVERPVLLASVACADRTDLDTHAWQLAWTLTTFLQRRGHHQDMADSQHTALRAGLRLGDAMVQARADRAIAAACFHLGRLDDAYAYLQQALDISRELDDQIGMAHAHLSFCNLLEAQGHPREALGHAEQAHDLFKTAGDRHGQARALNAAGWYHTHLGQHQQAIAVCQQALVLEEEIGDQHSLGITWDTVGYAHHQLGNHQKAAACYQQAFTMLRQVGDSLTEAGTLTRLGDTHHAAGNHHDARTTWQEAVNIFRQLGRSEADAVEERLRSNTF